MRDQVLQLVQLRTAQLLNALRTVLSSTLVKIMAVMLVGTFLVDILFIDASESDVDINFYFFLYLGFCGIFIVSAAVSLLLQYVSNAEQVHFLAGNVSYRNIMRARLIGIQAAMLAGSMGVAAGYATLAGAGHFLKAFMAMYSFSAISMMGVLLFNTQRVHLRARTLAPLYLALAILTVVSAVEAFQLYWMQEGETIPVGIFPINLLTSPMMANAYMLAFDAPLQFFLVELALALAMGWGAYSYPYHIVPNIDDTDPAPPVPDSAAAATVAKPAGRFSRRIPLADTGMGEKALDGYFRMEGWSAIIGITIGFLIIIFIFGIIFTKISLFYMSLLMVIMMNFMAISDLFLDMDWFSAAPVGAERLMLICAKRAPINSIGAGLVLSAVFVMTDPSSSLMQISTIAIVMVFGPWIWAGSLFLSIRPGQGIDSPSIAFFPITLAFLLPSILLFFVMTYDPLGLGWYSQLLVLPLAGLMALTAYISFRMAVKDYRTVFSEGRSLLRRSAAMLVSSGLVTASMYYLAFIL